MWVQADYQQVVGEVKERNRFYKALNRIRDIALINCNENTPEDVREQFKLIVQECDDALKSRKVKIKYLK
jgi:hypothetical protein